MRTVGGQCELQGRNGPAKVCDAEPRGRSVHTDKSTQYPSPLPGLPPSNVEHQGYPTCSALRLQTVIPPSPPGIWGSPGCNCVNLLCSCLHGAVSIGPTDRRYSQPVTLSLYTNYSPRLLSAKVHVHRRTIPCSSFSLAFPTSFHYTEATP